MSNHSLESEDSDDGPTLNLDSVMLQQLASSRLDRNYVGTRRLTSGHDNEYICYSSIMGRIASLDSHSIHPAAVKSQL